MFTREFWLGDNGALVRSLRTFGQTAAAMITVATFSPFDVGQWRNVAIVSVTAALVSLLMSLDRREALMAVPPTMLVAAPPPPVGYYSDATAPPTAPLPPPEPETPPHGCGESLR